VPGIDETSALSLWEDGARLSPLDRAVRLAAMIGGTSVDDAADLPISARDRLLLSELQRLGGGSVAVIATCPACATVHEADVALTPLLQSRDAAAPRVAIGGRRRAIRAPSSRDLAAAMTGDALNGLASLCCTPPEDELSTDEVAKVEDALERAFPLLNILIAMRCDDCATGFAQRLDPVPLLWSHIVRLAGQALADVDLLARTYGWTEAEVFALSPARRRHYCGLAAQ
jgi:hypothetical protein